MQQSNNLQTSLWPQSVLIIGCGLLGTSFAIRLKRERPDVNIVGVEVNHEHVQHVQYLGVFSDVVATVPNSRFDLAVLATPVDAAVRLLESLIDSAPVVMDICSVKTGICQRADELGMHNQFAPTHPMAGLAAGGPEHASADLFVTRPWIVIDGWPATTQLQHMIELTGAHVVSVPDAATHDEAMSAVSHGVHLVSLATMRAYNTIRSEMNEIAQLTGPAFRDVTRLSSSPPGFWVSTLLENRTHVMDHIHRVQRELEWFNQALHDRDRERLTELLQESQQAYWKWAEERDRR